MPVTDHILRVDFRRETVTSRAIPDRWIVQYAGGKGIGARYLYEELESGTDALADGVDRAAERVGERVWTPVWLFTVREGFSWADDALPEALSSDGDETCDDSDEETDDANGNDADVFESLLERYYDARDWNPEGRPTRTLLERLDLTELVDEPGPLESSGMNPGSGPDDGTRSASMTEAWSR